MGNTNAQCNVVISKHIFDQNIDIYFGHKDKVYVINKQFIVHVFGVCAKWYVEESNEQVSKSLAIHALYNCRFAPSNFFVD